MRSQRRPIILVISMFVAGCVSDLTREVPPVCGVHHAKMTKTTVPIRYGLIRRDDRERARRIASPSAFPNALDWFEGGCVLSYSSPRWALLYNCAACKIARQKWEYIYDVE